MSRTGIILMSLSAAVGGLLLYANLGPDRAPEPSVPPPMPAQPTPGPSPAEIQNGLAAIVAAVRPAVVSISVHPGLPGQALQAGMQMLEPFHAQPSTWIGSGVIVHPSGYVLTCRQVTQDAELVRVTLFRSGANTFMARRVATDLSSDLVLLKLPVNGGLPFATLGDSSRVRTGDLVLTVGSPFGLSKTVTHGIVSISHRAVSVGGRIFPDVIQTDAAINQGNCGGPLVNIDAQIIGITMAIYSTDTTFSGIGFAIPSNLARTFLQRTLGVVG